MTQQVPTLAKMISASARALAGFAASGPLPRDDRELEPVAEFDHWHNLLTSHLEVLAVALSMGHPEIFVEQVVWTKTLLKARGVATELFRSKIEDLSRAIAEHVPAEMAPQAAEYFDRALREFGREPAGLNSRLSGRTADEQLAARYLVSILEGDRRKASRLILEAADAGKSLTDLYFRVLQPAQEELGRMWVLGEINVAEEHFATTTSRLVMAQLHSRTACRAANGKTLVAAAVAGNQHDLGVQMVADIFEVAGWRVVQLGANVPAEDLAQAVEFYAADLLALAISLPSHLPSLREAVAAVRGSAAASRVKVLVGGCKVADAAELVKICGADDFAADAIEALRLACQLVGLPSTSVNGQPPP